MYHLLDVFPAFPMKNPPDQSLIDPVFLREGPLGFTHRGSDLAHLLCRQLLLVVVLALHGATVASPVLGVLLDSAGDHVMGIHTSTVAAEVPDLLSFLDFPSHQLKNVAMGMDRYPLGPCIEREEVIAGPLDCQRAIPTGSLGPEGRHLVHISPESFFVGKAPGTSGLAFQRARSTLQRARPAFQRTWFRLVGWMRWVGGVRFHALDRTKKAVSQPEESYHQRPRVFFCHPIEGGPVGVLFTFLAPTGRLL